MKSGGQPNDGLKLSNGLMNDNNDNIVR